MGGVILRWFRAVRERVADFVCQLYIAFFAGPDDLDDL